MVMCLVLICWYGGAPNANLLRAPEMFWSALEEPATPARQQHIVCNYLWTESRVKRGNLPVCHISCSLQEITSITFSHASLQPWRPQSYESMWEKQPWLGVIYAGASCCPSAPHPELQAPVPQSKSVINERDRQLQSRFVFQKLHEPENLAITSHHDNRTERKDGSLEDILVSNKRRNSSWNRFTPTESLSESLLLL